MLPRTRTRRLAPLLMAALCLATAVVAATTAPASAAPAAAATTVPATTVPATTVPATTVPDTTGPAAALPWPQFMLDARHTGFNAKEKTINRNTVNNLTLDYIAAGPADPEFGAFRRSSPAVVNGVAYLGDAIGNLVAFPATGCGLDVCAPLWTAQLSNGVHTSPAVDGGLVFVATSGNADNGLGQLYAFRAAGCGAATCQPVWVAPQVPNTDSSPVTANGMVYIASSDGLLRVRRGGLRRAEVRSAVDRIDRYLGRRGTRRRQRRGIRDLAGWPVRVRGVGLRPDHGAVPAAVAQYPRRRHRSGGRPDRGQRAGVLRQ
jgi:outer membrane protein assembly factor BamB